MSVKLVDVIGKQFALKNNIKKINGVPVEIKGYIDVETFKNIVQTVSLTCIDNGEYKAENREIARRFAIIKHMTNIEVDENDVTEIFKTTQGGNWYTQIECEVVKLPLWAEIELAIDKQIDAMILSRQTSFDKLCSDLSAILNTDYAQNFTEIKNVLNDLNNLDKNNVVNVAAKKATKKKSTK